MHRVTPMRWIKTQASRAAFVLAALTVAHVVCLVASAQNNGSLADATRQARAQKQGQPEMDGKAQAVIDEMMEDQNDGGAPGGFKTYNAGDYKVWVPAPYRV